MNVTAIYHDKKYYYIVAELLDGGSLHERLKNQSLPFSEKQTAFILKQVLLGLNYMHKNNFVHRDLKLENILLLNKEANKLDVKISDFGFACELLPG